MKNKKENDLSTTDPENALNSGEPVEGQSGGGLSAESQNSETKNFTPHLSAIEEEGRRNQPRNPSPKKTKERHSKENIAKAARIRELGALEPYMAATEKDSG